MATDDKQGVRAPAAGPAAEHADGCAYYFADAGDADALCDCDKDDPAPREPSAPTDDPGAELARLRSDLALERRGAATLREWLDLRTSQRDAARARVAELEAERDSHLRAAVNDAYLDRDANWTNHRAPIFRAFERDKAPTVPDFAADAMASTLADEQSLRNWLRAHGQGAALDAHGYARGEAAPYVCPCCYHQRGDEVPADGRSTREEMAATIARLSAALAEEQDAHRESSRLLADRLADLKRVEGELTAERSLTAELREMEAEALASADRWKAASERHEREAAEARAEAEENRRAVVKVAQAGTLDARDAPLDGAREEQERWGKICGDVGAESAASAVVAMRIVGRAQVEARKAAPARDKLHAMSLPTLDALSAAAYAASLNSSGAWNALTPAERTAVKARHVFTLDYLAGGVGRAAGTIYAAGPTDPPPTEPAP